MHRMGSPAAIRVAIHRGAAAAPRLGGHAADMQLQMIRHHPNRDQAGSNQALYVNQRAKP